MFPACPSWQGVWKKKQFVFSVKEDGKETSNGDKMQYSFYLVLNKSFGFHLLCGYERDFALDNFKIFLDKKEKKSE